MWGGGQFLVPIIGWTVPEFKKMKKAAKGNPAEKQRLLEHFTGISDAISDK